MCGAEVPLDTAARSRPLSPMRKAALLMHTVRHLRAVQIVGRARRALRRCVPETGPAPETRHPDKPCVPCAPHSPSVLSANQARFLNETRSIEGADAWNARNCSRLWLYNLHYFGDLVAVDAEERTEWDRALIARWIRENAPGSGVGWEPYPTSLRIVNWMKWALNGEVLGAEAIHSLAVQTRWLRRHVEWHLLGNHVLANAKALVFAGAFYRGAEAETWLRKGIAILDREIDEQILSDGGHFERSPMYHCIVLEDLLDLLNLRCAFEHRLGVPYDLLCAKLNAAVPKMLAWLAAMTHPDGEISLFNDAALGVAASPFELMRYAVRLGFAWPSEPADGLTHLAATGYVRMQRGPMVAILDVGEIGPPYLPGHAHADTLSYELSLLGRRVAANSGTSTYAPGPQRSYERSTAAHNTVEVDGADSSEVWGVFRAGRRARPSGLSLREDPNEVRVACTHDGYMRLRGRALHARTWVLSDEALTVTDHVSGRHTTAASRVHLHPEVPVRSGAVDGVSTVRLDVDQQPVELTVSQPANLVQTLYHPEFGLSVPRVCIRATFRRECVATWRWDTHSLD